MKKLVQWEFWPFWVFYIPVYFYYLFLSIKARSFVFFSTANPAMHMGGFTNYSKLKILELLPRDYIPKSYLLHGTAKFDSFQKLLNDSDWIFPVVLKPDRGERGFGVAIINNMVEAKNYLYSCAQDVIVQEYINHKIELGVMYVRKPGDKVGKITSVVIKEFLYVVGDGNKTLKELIQYGDRSRFYASIMLEKFNAQLHYVPVKGEEFELEAIGNHCRGTKFLNGNHLITEQLTQVFDRITQDVIGFNFGRFDLRVKSLDDLYKGTTIKIMEVNGANSEPAHIYDPDTTLINAYQDLFQHWKNLYRVSIENHNRFGVPYMSLKEGIRNIRVHLRDIRKLEE